MMNLACRRKSPLRYLFQRQLLSGQMQALHTEDRTDIVWVCSLENKPSSRCLEVICKSRRYSRCESRVMKVPSRAASQQVYPSREVSPSNDTISIDRQVDLKLILNLWTPPPPPKNFDETNPVLRRYDINFCMPFRILETDDVRVEPLFVSDLPSLSFFYSEYTVRADSIPSATLHLGGFMPLPDSSWDCFGEIWSFPHPSQRRPLRRIAQAE